MASLPLTQELVEQAQNELALAEEQLAADPNNKWRLENAILARKKVRSILQLLNETRKDQA